MIIVSDTTCLSTLARIGELSLLQTLFGEVMIPRQVYQEFMALELFGVSVDIFDATWIVVRDPVDVPLLAQLLANKKIDPGEAFAIVLALEHQADWLILDDLNARKVATDLGLNITGLGGILLQAKSKGFIFSVAAVLALCTQKANFRLAPAVYARLLDLAGE